MESLTKSNENVNPPQDLHLCDDLLTLASASYIHSSDYEIRSNMLTIIRSQLPPGFKYHVTHRGVVIELVNGELAIHPFAIRLPGQDPICENCGKDLEQGQILSMERDRVQNWAKITVQCECGYFSTILEMRESNG